MARARRRWMREQVRGIDPSNNPLLIGKSFNGRLCSRRNRRRSRSVGEKKPAIERGCVSRPLRLQRVDDFQCSADIARQFGRIDQVRSGVGHVLAVVILFRVVVQLVQLIIERMCWMGCPAVASRRKTVRHRWCR